MPGCNGSLVPIDVKSIGLGGASTFVMVVWGRMPILKLFVGMTEYGNV